MLRTPRKTVYRVCLSQKIGDIKERQERLQSPLTDSALGVSALPEIRLGLHFTVGIGDSRKTSGSLLSPCNPGSGRPTQMLHC